MTCKYSISQYTKDKANKLNVYVKISTNKAKKIDVFDKKNDKNETKKHMHNRNMNRNDNRNMNMKKKRNQTNNKKKHKTKK